MFSIEYVVRLRGIFFSLLISLKMLYFVDQLRNFFVIALLQYCIIVFFFYSDIEWSWRFSNWCILFVGSFLFKKFKFQKNHNFNFSIFAKISKNFKNSKKIKAYFNLDRTKVIDLQVEDWEKFNNNCWTDEEYDPQNIIFYRKRLLDHGKYLNQ